MMDGCYPKNHNFMTKTLHTLLEAICEMVCGVIYLCMNKELK